jgi:hypothetical protein
LAGWSVEHVALSSSSPQPSPLRKLWHNCVWAFDLRVPILCCK